VQLYNGRENAGKAVQNIYENLRNRLPAQPSCNELKQAANTSTEAIIEEEKKKNMGAIS
jgi:hypothetical protein